MARGRRYMLVVVVAFATAVLASTTASAAGVVVSECGRMKTPSGSKAWAYTSPKYDCSRARKILRAWLFDGARADLRGWRCYSATQAGQIVTCRRGVNRVHLQRTGRKGAKVRVD